MWARPHAAGLWFLTADCLCWALGTLSYYLVPALGPNFAFPWLYEGLHPTGVSVMQDSLLSTRQTLLHSSTHDQGVQSLAAFASLHVAITLMMCLLAHWTMPVRWVRRALWIYLPLVVVSTTYFGWHYIVDDVAGALIALIAVYGGGWAVGFRFDRRGRLVSSVEAPAPSDARTQVTEAAAPSAG